MSYAMEAEGPAGNALIDLSFDEEDGSSVSGSVPTTGLGSGRAASTEYLKHSRCIPLVNTSGLTLG